MSYKEKYNRDCFTKKQKEITKYVLQKTECYKTHTKKVRQKKQSATNKSRVSQKQSVAKNRRKHTKNKKMLGDVWPFCNPFVYFPAQPGARRPQNALTPTLFAEKVHFIFCKK